MLGTCIGRSSSPVNAPFGAFPLIPKVKARSVGRYAYVLSRFFRLSPFVCLNIFPKSNFIAGGGIIKSRVIEREGLGDGDGDIDGEMLRLIDCEMLLLIEREGLRDCEGLGEIDIEERDKDLDKLLLMLRLIDALDDFEILCDGDIESDLLIEREGETLTLKLWIDLSKDMLRLIERERFVDGLFSCRNIPVTFIEGIAIGIDGLIERGGDGNSGIFAIGVRGLKNS